MSCHVIVLPIIPTEYDCAALDGDKINFILSQEISNG